MNEQYVVNNGENTVTVLEIVSGWGESKEHKLRLMNGLLCEGQEIIIGRTVVLQRVIHNWTCFTKNVNIIMKCIIFIIT